MDSRYQAPPIPSAFIWKRAHSLTGLWLVLFLIEHLFTNSQAALWIGEDGKGFIDAVNWIQSLPFLPLIEIFLLGLPLLIHGAWGVKYLFEAKYNNGPSDGSVPSLPNYGRNKAYTWQRVTAWLLLFGIAAHVVHMRFIEYPKKVSIGNSHYYLVSLSNDEGLSSLSKRLDFKLFDKDSKPVAGSSSKDQKKLAVTSSFGTAELLVVRDTFKSPLMILLYTGLVLASCFHAFNGLWTFMISWGVTLTARSQQLMWFFSIFLMVLISFLGLAAIFGTYFANLKG